MRRFTSFAVIDWSGEAVAQPKGLALAEATTGRSAPALLRPEGGWSRGRIADWLEAHADAGTDLLIGVDLSPGLPFLDQGSYFPGWPDSPSDAKPLWRFVDEASTEDEHLGVNGFLRHEHAHRHFRHHTGTGAAFAGGRGRLRVCEIEQARMGLSPSSCLNLVGAAQVGKSSLTGMRVLHRLDGRIPVWPFDPVPATGPVIVEIYTSIAARAAGVRKGLSKIRDHVGLNTALEALGSDQHPGLARHDDHSTDAIVTTAWLRIAAHRPELWSPAALTPELARAEGWTFGVP
ncbi:hypothetical protein [uncultured Sphingomonas sp.]|uniref:hypothetical protein n=1 Tax=uncultured Sphingomonas sp. TaxID=158754 RepID=UPI0035CB9D41